MEDAVVFTDEIAGFHAQQAAEKPLKIRLIPLGEPYPLTHDPESPRRLVERRERVDKIRADAHARRGMR